MPMEVALDWGHQEWERIPRVKPGQNPGDEMSLAGLWLPAFAFLCFCFSGALPSDKCDK